MTRARTIRWKPAGGEGTEHLEFRHDGGRDGDCITARSVVVGARGGVPYGLGYRIDLTEDWRVRTVELSLTGGAGLRLSNDGAGNWRDADGRPLPAFTGCLFPDISATPFTNTLPIRRLGLAIGESARIRVLYLPVPSLVPEVVEQRYTRLAERRWLYEGLFRGFQAELEVDGDGIVLDYPETFLRIAPEA